MDNKEYQINNSDEKKLQKIKLIFKLEHKELKRFYSFATAIKNYGIKNTNINVRNLIKGFL